MTTALTGYNVDRRHLAGVRLCVRKPSNNIHNYQNATVLTSFHVKESPAKAASVTAVITCQALTMTIAVTDD
jgi:hypothetical protein